MKISNEKKGIKPFWEEENEAFDKILEQEVIEMQDAGIKSQSDEYLDNLERIEKNWKNQGKTNFEKLKQQQMYPYDNPSEYTNCIGKRIQHLREKQNMKAKEFYATARIAKTTLYRLEQGTHIPSDKIFSRVLEALSISLADFSCFPENFKEWTEALEESKDEIDIFKFRDKVLSEIKNGHFVWIVSGRKVRIPHNHINLIRKLLEDSFGVLDLLPHAPDNK